MTETSLSLIHISSTKIVHQLQGKVDIRAGYDFSCQCKGQSVT